MRVLFKGGTEVKFEGTYFKKQALKLSRIGRQNVGKFCFRNSILIVFVGLFLKVKKIFEYKNLI